MWSSHIESAVHDVTVPMSRCPMSTGASEPRAPQPTRTPNATKDASRRTLIRFSLTSHADDRHVLRRAEAVRERGRPVAVEGVGIGERAADLVRAAAVGERDVE